MKKIKRFVLLGSPVSSSNKEWKMGLVKTRTGENFHVWERRERFYMMEDKVFFTTREGIEVGPFPSPNMARRGLEIYKYVVNECSTTGHYASRVVTRL